MSSLQPVIGLEVHVQLSTATKMFCRCRNRFGDPPNTNVCPVCLGLPGSLPVANCQAIEYGMKAGLVLNCSIARFSKFDRKNYFYPDLPKNYQISQYDLPMCGTGWLDADVHGERTRFGITRVHLEEDAGKLVHDNPGGESLVDLNRAGTPLLEIVSEPDMRSPEEAYAYLTTLRQLISYLGISDCTMEEGSLRCDANVSIRPQGSKTLGTKVEIKNMNSFKSVEKALAYEIRRQTAAVESGEPIVQETRLFDAATEKTSPMRSKEQAHDYRYFPDPDLVPLTFSDEQVARWRAELPEAPGARKTRFVTAFELSAYDAAVLTADRACADYFEEVVRAGAPAKPAANWIANNLLAKLNEEQRSIVTCPITPVHMAAMILMVERKEISSTNAKNDVFPELFSSGKPPADIAAAKGLAQVCDTGQIDLWVRQAIERNPDSLASLREGKVKAAGKIVGAVMQASKGKANPALVNARLRVILGTDHGITLP